MPKVDFKDYYKTLEVERSVDEKSLRSAFRKLARKHHPDINPGDSNAEDRFKEINEAYDVLSDPDKRKLYDRFGEDWQRYQEAGFTGDEQFDPTSAGSRHQDFGSWYSGQPQGSSRSYEFTGDSGYSDFFDTLFGDSQSFGRGTRTTQSQSPRRGQDLEADVGVTFQEAFHGTTRRFDVQTQDLCEACGGRGIAGEQLCSTCQGDGYVNRTRAIEVTIPPGVTTGSRVRVSGQGGKGTAGGPTGDVYLSVSVADDPRFEREGSTLRTAIDVPLYTAILGGEAVVPTPTGQVALRIPAGSQQGKVFRLRGQGMPSLKGKDRGDLFAKANIMIPDNLSDEEVALFEQLRDHRSPAPSED